MNEIDIDNDEIVLFTTNNKSNKNNNNNKQDSTDSTDSSNNNKNNNSSAVVSSNSFGLNTEDFKKMPFPYKVSIIYILSKVYIQHHVRLSWPSYTIVYTHHTYTPNNYTHYIWYSIHYIIYSYMTSYVTSLKT